MLEIGVYSVLHTILLESLFYAGLEDEELIKRQVIMSLCLNMQVFEAEKSRYISKILFLATSVSPVLREILGQFK